MIETNSELSKLATVRLIQINYAVFAAE